MSAHREFRAASTTAEVAQPLAGTLKFISEGGDVVSGGLTRWGRPHTADPYRDLMTVRLDFALLASGAELDEETNTYEINGAGVRGVVARTFPAALDLVAVIALRVSLDETQFEVEIAAVAEDGTEFGRIGMPFESAGGDDAPGMLQDVRPPPVPLRLTVPAPVSLEVRILIGRTRLASLPLVVVGS